VFSASTLLIVALFAFAAGALVALAFSRQITRDLRERYRTAETERDAQRLTSGEAQKRVAELETTLVHERKSAAEKLATVNDAQARLIIEFKAISADALARNNDAFLKLAGETFGKLQQQSTGDLDQRRQAIAELVKPLKESLEKVGLTFGEVEKARASAYGQLSEQLKSLSSDQARVQAEAGKLSTALRSTSYAGSWGELQLRRVVEMADMLPHVDFMEQATSEALRADMVVRMPGGQRIVVDAKAPVQSYRDAVEATDENIRAARLAEHAQKVRGHIDALGAKSYWEQFQPAPEFVVLFLPGDHFLTAALQADPTLLERALGRRVLLATPTTLIALLKAAAYGWRHEALSQNAEEISTIGKALFDRISTFAEHLDKVGRGLEAANKGFNQAVGSFESALMPGARRFAELGAKGTKDLALPEPVETAPRDVTKRE